MRPSPVQFISSVGVTILIGSGLYWLVGDSGLASVTGILWGSGLALSLQLYRSYPSIEAEPTWERGRWVGIGGGLIALAALLGVSPSLPISPELRLGLGALVIGAGFVGTATAALAELERFDDTSG